MEKVANAPLRLLVVDDDEQLRATLARRFQREGMEVVAAGSAEGALACAKRDRFDVALLEQMALFGGAGPDAGVAVGL